MRLDQQIKKLVKEKSFSKRLQLYEILEQENCFEIFSNGGSSEAIVKQVSSLLNCLLSDFIVSDDESVYLLLNITSQFFSDMDYEFSIDDHIAFEFLKKLQSMLSLSKSNATTQKIFNILCHQQFSEKVLKEVIGSLLGAVPFTKTFLDATIINILNKFTEQCPGAMESHVELWLKLLLRLTCHSDIYVREQAVSSLKDKMHVVLSNKKKIITSCSGFLKEEVLPALNELCAKDGILLEILSVQLPAYMTIIGEDCRRSTRLSNSVFKFVEKGFCHVEEKIKVSAFKAWECLIECFSKNKDLLASSKYFRLFTQPLKLRVKTKELMIALVETMWKLAICLDDNLPDVFEMLCVPLLGICFRGTAGVMQLRRSSGRSSFSTSQAPFESVQKLGIEMLSHLLLPSSEQKHHFTLAPLHHPYFGSPAVFFRFYDALIAEVTDAICRNNGIFSTDFLLNIWRVVLSSVQEGINRKRGGVEMFKSLCQSSYRIVEVDLDPDFLLSIVSSLTLFPARILNSSLYCQSESMSDSMHGTPIVSVMQLLFSPHICRGSLPKPRFEETVRTSIAIGMERRIGNLEFIQSAVTLLQEADQAYLGIWTYLCDQVLDYIEKSENVNDGDSLEHDFSSLYKTLNFAFRFIFQSNSNIAVASHEQARQSWSRLFRRFASCTSEVANTEPNEARQYIACCLLEKLLSVDLTSLDTSQLRFLEVVLFELVNDADFSLESSARCKVKNTKKANAVGESDPVFTGFNCTIAKVLKELEGIFSQPSSSFPPFNILPTLLVIATSASQPHLAPFFTSASPFLLEYFRNSASLSCSVMSFLENNWSRTLLRLPFSSSLFESDIVCELFTAAFSSSRTSPIYRSTADFWKMKVLDAFDPTAVSQEFLTVLTRIYKNEGFPLTWDDESNADETINLNVSTVSERSMDECDEVSHSGTSDGESDVHIDVTDDVSANEVASSNDDVDDVTSSEVSSTDDDFNDNDDDDVTQLDKRISHLDDCYDDPGVNRSLNLRSLASNNTSLDDGGSERCTPPARLMQDLPKEATEMMDASVPPVDPNDEDSKITIESSSDSASEVLDSSGCIIISESEESPTRITSAEFPVESDKSMDGTYYSCGADDSFETVEMAQVSVNVHESDLIINSSLDDDGRSFSEDAIKCVSRMKSKLLDPTPETPEEDPKDVDESNLTTSVEMAEISVMPDLSMVSTDQELDDKASTSNVASAEEEVKTDESVYEYVEMAEMSVIHDPPPPQKRPDEVAEDTDDDRCPSAEKSSKNSNKTNGETLTTVTESDSSEYELVEMKEVSICADPHLCRNLKIVINKVNISESDRSQIARAEDFCQKIPEATSSRDASPVHKESKPSNIAQEGVCDPEENNYHSVAPSVDERGREKDRGSNISLDGSFASCEGDLGVKPLDNSFDGFVSEVDKISEGTSTRVQNAEVLEVDVIMDNDLCGEEEQAFDKEKMKEKQRDILMQTSSFDSSANSDAKRRKESRRKNAFRTPEVSNSAAKASVCESFNDVTASNAINDVTATNFVNDVTSINTSLRDNNVASTNSHLATSNGADAVVESPTMRNANKDPSSTPATSQGSERHDSHLVSPQASDRSDEPMETPKSCLGKRLSSLREKDDNTSPSVSPCGILKKKAGDYLSPATKARRVSFAEPLSVAKESCSLTFQSPHSSPRHFKRQTLSSRLVNRRLSLPVAHRSYEQPSPISVRSASIAAVIADIKARNNVEANGNVTPTSSKTSSCDVSAVTLSQLKDVSFLRSLSSYELERLTDHVHLIAPIIHSILVEKLKNHNR